MSIVTDLLKQSAALYDIQVTDAQLILFDRYAELMLSWNEKVNLTAIKDAEGIAIKHFLDSILLQTKLHIEKGASLIDVGTGAGFPAVPIKIMRDDIKITLADGTNKRVLFLNELVKALGISAETIHARAEELGQNPAYREHYDYATARAVAHLRELTEYCLPFVKLGGCFAAMKSGQIDTELSESENAIELLGGRVEEILRFSLPDTSERTIIVIKKISHTSPIYPRPSAQMAKKPL